MLIPLICALSAVVFQGGTSPKPLVDWGTTSSENGLLTGQIVVGTAKITVYLPDDIRPGDTISGTVVAEAGVEPKVRLNGDTQIPNGRFTFKAPPTDLAPLYFSCDVGGETKSLIVPFPPNRQTVRESAFRIDPVVVRSRSARVTGPFDGDSSNTRASTLIESLPVLAESPRQCMFQSPSIAGGAVNVTVNERGQESKLPTRLVTPNLRVDKPVILTGQTATATIRLIGLQDLGKEKVQAILTNRNPNIASMQNGDVQSFAIDVTNVSDTGEWRQDVTIIGRNPGTYNLGFKFVAMGSTPPPDELIPPFDIGFVAGADQPLGSGTARSVVIRSMVPSNSIQTAQASISRIESGTLSTTFPALVSSDGRATATVVVPAPGTWVLSFSASDSHGQTATIEKIVDVGPKQPPFTLGPKSNLPKDALGPMIALTAQYERIFQQAISYCQSLLDQARSEREKAAEERGKAHADRIAAEDERAAKAKLERIDAILEGRLPGIANDLKKQAERIRQIEQKIGPATTKQELDDAVAKLQKALEDCEKNCADLKKQKADLEAENAEIEGQLTGIAAQIQAMFLADGWTGTARFDAKAGIIRWGFIGDHPNHALSDYQSPESQKFNELDKQRKALQKKLKANKAKISELDDAIADCIKRCEELKKQLEEAKKAAAEGDAKRAAEAQQEQDCVDAHLLLQRLLSALEGMKSDQSSTQEEIDALEKRIKDLLDRCPKTPEEVDQWRKDMDDLIASKKELEKTLGDDANAHDDSASGHDDTASGHENAAKAAEDEARRQAEEARLAELRRQADEAEAIRQAAAAKRRAAQKEADDQKKIEDDFAKWLDDMVKRGWIDDDDAKDVLQKIADAVGAAGSAIGEGAKSASKGGSGASIGRSIALEGAYQLFIMIYYWWIEAEMKGAIDRLRPQFDNRDFQLVLAMLINEKGVCGVIEDRGKSYFWIRKNGRTLVFRCNRDGGLVLVGAAP